MNQYITAAEYRALGGTIPQATDAELDKWLKQASLKIDILTRNRIAGVELSEIQTDAIQNACMYEADYLYNNSTNEMSGVSGWSVPDMSVSYSQKTGHQKWLQDNLIDPQVKDLLSRAGLTWRGV